MARSNAKLTWRCPSPVARHRRAALTIVLNTTLISAHRSCACFSLYDAGNFSRTYRPSSVMRSCMAGFAQRLLAMLADQRGAARSHLLLAADFDGAVDGQVIGVADRHEMAGGQRLLVGRDVLRLGDDAEDDAAIVEDAAPMREVAR